MATRTRKSTKPVQAETIETIEVEAILVEPAPGWAETFRRALGAGDASWKRILCTGVASLLVGYGIGMLAAEVLAYVTLGALLLTGSMFLASVIYVLGILLTLMASFYVGKYVAHQCLTGGVDRAAVGAYRKVTSFFSRKSEVPA